MTRRLKIEKGLPAPNRVLNVEKDGEYLRVQFVRANGEIVMGEYKRIGWAWGPQEDREKINAILNSPPLVTYRGPGRRAAKPAAKREPGQ